MAVLVFIFILTTIVVIYLQEVDDRIKYRFQTSGDDELRSIAYNYLEHTYGVLKEFQMFDDTLSSPIQGWGTPLDYEPFPFEYEGLVASVWVEDQTSKLPLSKIDETDFVVLLESLGVDSFTAAGLRDKYFDWVDSDDETRIRGAETNEYELNRRLYLLTPTNAALKSIDDFQYIAGFSDWMDPDSRYYNPDLYRAFTEMLTVEWDYPVNLNIASSEILRFFEERYKMDAQAVLEYQLGRDGFVGTEDDEIIDLSDGKLPSRLKMALGETTGSGLYSSEMQVCKIHILLERYESYRFRLEATVALNRSSGGPVLAETEADETDSAEDEVPENSTETNKDESKQSNNSLFEVLVIRENM